jgi:hypothetical protein
MGLSKRLHQFLALSARQQRAMLLAWLALPVCHLALRRWGLARVQAWVLTRPLRPTTSTGHAGLTRDDLEGLGYAVNRAAKFPLRERACLRRSLVLLWVLRRHGIEAQLCIGVRFLEGALDAHAWVEWQGHPINDRADVAQDFASFGELAPLDAFHSS